MRHRVAGFKLGRNTAHRRAMWRNMAVSFFTHGQITTTVPKAKSIQPFLEKLISLAKKGDLTSRRRVIAEIGDRTMVKFDDDPAVERNRFGEIIDAPRVVKHLFDEIAPKFADRNGGCTRIIRLGTSRLGDGGDLCVIQLVGDEQGPQVGGKNPRRKRANKREEYAAKLLKGGAGKATEEAAEEAAPEADTATAVAEPEEQAPEAEASAPEADAAEGEEKKD